MIRFKILFQLLSPTRSIEIHTNKTVRSRIKFLNYKFIISQVDILCLPGSEPSEVWHDILALCVTLKILRNQVHLYMSSRTIMIRLLINRLKIIFTPQKEKQKSDRDFLASSLQ